MERDREQVIQSQIKPSQIAKILIKTCIMLSHLYRTTLNANHLEYMKAQKILSTKT